VRVCVSVCVCMCMYYVFVCTQALYHHMFVVFVFVQDTFFTVVVFNGKKYTHTHTYIHTFSLARTHAVLSRSDVLTCITTYTYKHTGRTIASYKEQKFHERTEYAYLNDFYKAPISDAKVCMCMHIYNCMCMYDMVIFWLLFLFCFVCRNCVCVCVIHRR